MLVSRYVRKEFPHQALFRGFITVSCSWAGWGRWEAKSKEYGARGEKVQKVKCMADGASA